MQNIPQCVVNIISWKASHGFIPYVKQESPKSTFRIESYTDEKSKEYKLYLVLHADEDEELDIAIDDKLKYKGGYEVKAEGEAAELVTFEQEPNNLKIKFGKAADGKKVDIVVTAK